MDWRDMLTRLDVNCGFLCMLVYQNGHLGGIPGGKKLTKKLQSKDLAELFIQ